MKMRVYCHFCKGQLDDKEELVENKTHGTAAHLRCLKNANIEVCTKDHDHNEKSSPKD